MKKVDILGVNVTSASRSELNDTVRTFLREHKKRMILYLNIHGSNLAHKYSWLNDLYNRSDLVMCDGTGVLWGSKVLGNGIKERISFTDWGSVLTEIFRDDENTVFLLGDTDDVIVKALSALKSDYSGLKISGSHHGYFDMNSDENTKILEKINFSGSDVLFVGMGMTRQERWILDNFEKVNVKMIISCGGLFKFWAGIRKRCPVWVTRIGLEWFYHLLHDPRRLFPRYFPGNFTFFFRILKQKVSGKKGSDKIL